MKSSCLIKSLLLISSVATAVLADVAPPDSKVVSRSVAIVNTGSYPDRVFIGLEFFPGKSTPVSASKIGAGTRLSTAYKFNWIDVYSAAASAWPALKDKYGISDGSGETGSGLTGIADKLCCSGELTAVTGTVESTPQWVSDTSKLESEVIEYQVQGKNADKFSLYGIQQTFSDGRKTETLQGAAGVREIRSAARATSLRARMTWDGRSLLWIPNHSGIVTVSLIDVSGKTVWSARTVVTGGELETVSIPMAMPMASAAKGRYVVFAQGLGWSQSVPLEIGNR